MTNYKLLLLALLLPFASGITRAQSSASNSPYSRFGLGTLNEQSQGFNQGMGGVALGMRSSRFINMQNPASYSAIDSLSFLFDVGMSLQQGSFKSGNSKISANNTSLNYVSAAFRIRKGLGMSLGFLPYTTIGYNFSNTETTGTAYPSGNVITQGDILLHRRRACRFPRAYQGLCRQVPHSYRDEANWCSPGGWPHWRYWRLWPRAMLCLVDVELLERDNKCGTHAGDIAQPTEARRSVLEA